MGLLDDAIREHLDLKRRRGADPADVERAEREALGPVRRGPEEIESADVGDNGIAAEEPREHEANGDHGWGESFDEESQLFGDEARPSFGHVPSTPESVERERESAPESVPEPPEPELYDEFATQEHSATTDPFVDDADDEPPAPPPAAAPSHEDEEHPLEDPPPPRRSATPPAADVGHPGQETAEYDVEQDLHKDPEDPLEETPEFLQDTPDHDRLWFEQRPPRDFDFEG